MSAITREIDRGTRAVGGVTVTITELVWADGGRSFQVQRTDTGADLTVDGCFDDLPTDIQIRGLLDEAAGLWRCPGCHTALDVDLTDLIGDHLRDCLPGHLSQIRGGDRSSS